MTNKIAAAIAAATLSVAATAPALAHHSHAMFDTTKQVNITGVVKEFKYTNPHSYVQLLVKTKSGNTQEWTLELQGGVASMRARGVKRDAFVPGDRIVAVVEPLRSGLAGGAMISAKFEDGRSYTDTGPMR